jgi:hypothetical protein
VDTVDALTYGIPAARPSKGIPGPFVQYSHIANEAPKFMFTVDGKVPEEMTKALEIPPRFLR